MSDNLPKKLPDRVIHDIKSFINNNPEKFHTGISSGQPVAQGIFEMIRRNGGVLVYYPIRDADEVNNAFLLKNMPLKKGGYTNIIFINTYKTIEKQIYAAAHELGHLLDIKSHLTDVDTIDEDDIVNRFAAELLMPEDQFVQFMDNLIKGRLNSGGITINDVLYIIVEAMDYFCVPYNAVVIRLEETGLLLRDSAKQLADGSERLPLEDIMKTVGRIISEKSGGVLRTVSQKKEIEGLAALLNKADNNPYIAKQKISHLREAFDLLADDQETILDEKMELGRGLK